MPKMELRMKKVYNLGAISAAECPYDGVSLTFRLFYLRCIKLYVAVFYFGSVFLFAFVYGFSSPFF